MTSIKHYGMPRRSGRYPWGSGKDPYQSSRDFLGQVEMLKRKGQTEAEIARGLGVSVATLRARKSIAKTEARKAQISEAISLREKGLSTRAIAEKLDIPESTVRTLLKPAKQEKLDKSQNIASQLEKHVAKTGYLDVGEGVERFMGVSSTSLATSIAMLKDQGYNLHYVKVEQLGTGKMTTVKVLTKPGVEYSELLKNRDKIGSVASYSEDGGRTFLGIEKPVDISSKRISVRYAEDGGTDRDGVIEIRRGVEDLNMGSSRYAQVRIAVDGTHYLKGMCVYADDLPDGVDIRFNTNKSKTSGDIKDVLKTMKDDSDNPFGATTRQIHYTGKDGKQHLSALNIVNEEGDWDRWSRNLSSQMLSKQQPSLAKRQLGIAKDIRVEEFNDIMSLTNPAVKRKLLETFADSADSAAVHLKAAAMPRQRTQVILPVPELSDREIYAPNFANGTRVALIRHPHGGIFEIPDLVVNNKNPKAKSLLGNALDAVGINPKVAGQLSGADFDGDTVLVIPNDRGAIKTAPPLKALKGFDTRASYPGYEGMKRMTSRGTQMEMGLISNLITDMTIKGASQSEIARAVRHSMVVIDAEKHGLNYRQSYIDHGIAQLKEKYQGRATAGASTLISKASSTVRVEERRDRRASEGGYIDPETGKRIYVKTGATYTDKKGNVVPRLIKSKVMSEVDDARTISSGTLMEDIYADYANSMKALANRARKELLATSSTPYSPSAYRAYSEEVSSLKAKLNVALKNAPRERHAQVIANAVVKAKKQANPDITPDELKRLKTQALAEARARTGARKSEVMVDISPREWTAIQAGAISNNMLERILDNADLDKVRELATPRARVDISDAKKARIMSMISSGYTQGEIAETLGISASSVNKVVHE